MLPQTYRFDLRSNPEFVNTSSRFETRFFRVYYKKGSTGQGAVIVAKHVSPLATVRNKAKRALREVLIKTFQTRPDSTIVLYAKRASINTSSSTLYETLQSVLPR